MTDVDPLVPHSPADIVWWLESCEDEEVDPDSAVKTLESVAGVLQHLPSD
ncbi:hypothetical protein ACIP96_17230 [Streptomyces nigra]